MLISITIIGHREAGHLQELLPRLGWADEVIYVDCESGDGNASFVTGAFGFTAASRIVRRLVARAEAKK